MLALFVAFSLNRIVDNTGTAKLDEEFKLKINEKILIREIGAAVTFLRVVEDSRCPVNVYCVWAGRVTVEVSIMKGNEEAFKINLTLADGGKKEFDGYTITLLRVDPQREYPDKMEISASEYEITLKISR